MTQTGMRNNLIVLTIFLQVPGSPTIEVQVWRDGVPTKQLQEEEETWILKKS